MGLFGALGSIAGSFLGGPTGGSIGGALGGFLTTLTPVMRLIRIIVRWRKSSGNGKRRCPILPFSGEFRP